MAANNSGEAVVQYSSDQTDANPKACGSFVRMKDDNSKLAADCNQWHGVVKSGDTLIVEKADIESLLLSLGNISGIFMGTQDGNVTTTASIMQNILDCPQVTSGGFLFVKAKYN